MNRTTILGGLAAALAAVAIAGCGSTTAPSATSSATAAAPSVNAQHNDADIAFVQGMVPHHSQAVDMSQLVAGHTTNPKVIDLAAQIAQAQGPEITRMQGFLQSWNVPAAPTSGMSGMSGSGSAMPGMMSDQQMHQLGAANGAAFDTMWLQMMTEHHTGAITMARTELRDGQSTDAKALAQKIIDAQQAEIATMKQLLGTS